MSPIDKDDNDPAFVELSARLRYRVDSVFDSIVSSGAQLQRSSFEVSPGGFIVEESESEPNQHEAGGFVVEDLPPDPQSRIPLSDIPRALQLLDLVPDDDIIGVFENAATGWGAQNARNDGVSRKDWRAVCAALLEGEHAEGSDEENPVVDEYAEIDASNGSDSDEYQMEELSSDTEESSSDEYGEPSTTAKVKNTHKASQTTSTKSSGTKISGQLTGSQKAQCRQEFSRFFPHVPDSQLDHQRITIGDITRVADLLKENLKTEEILEMLEAFSTSPDKSMSLADFEHMMILTKLVQRHE